MIESDNYLELLAKFAVSLPRDMRFYANPDNAVARLLFDLADCVHAVNEARKVSEEKHAAD